jgi:hypothetical protein
MKKFLLSLLVVGISALVIALFITHSKNKPGAVISLNHPFSLPQKSQGAKSEAIISQKAETVSQQPVEALFKEFDLPQNLQAELVEAQRSGSINNEWGEGNISIKELQKVGLTPAQLSQPELDNKVKNITAGLSISDKSFVQELNNCLPDKTIEDEQARVLNSEALSAMGFSGLMEHNYSQAEQAFTALIHNYADTKAAPVVHLELVRLMSEENRLAEARQLLDNAASLYGDDKEYMAMAQSLKKEMEINE